MTPEKLREVVAFSIRNDVMGDVATEMPDDVMGMYLDSADAVLAALRDAGLAIVPKEPSEAMVEAHIESCAGQCDEAGPENVRAAWEAMLSAGDLLGKPDADPR